MAPDPVKAATPNGRKARVSRLKVVVVTPSDKKAPQAKKTRQPVQKARKLSEKQLPGRKEIPRAAKKPQPVAEQRAGRRAKKADAMRCKARPSDNRPKGGGGSGKSFVPWSKTKFGCK